MKTPPTLILSALAILLTFSVLSGSAQTTPKPNPDYDAALAKKVGADKIGMKQYVLAVLKTGPNDATIKGKERDEIFKGHFANIQRMAKAGQLVVAGPFGDGTGDWRGLYIFNVTTIDEAKKLTETDPTIRSGVLIGEYHKWYGSAGMMEINRIHQTLTENAQ
jgi:uncharacterized protein YciI